MAANSHVLERHHDPACRSRVGVWAGYAGMSRRKPREGRLGYTGSPLSRESRAASVTGRCSGAVPGRALRAADSTHELVLTGGLGRRSPS